MTIKVGDHAKFNGKEYEHYAIFGYDHAGHLSAKRTHIYILRGSNDKVKAEEDD